MQRVASVSLALIQEKKTWLGNKIRKCMQNLHSQVLRHAIHNLTLCSDKAFYLPLHFGGILTFSTLTRSFSSTC